MRKTRVYTCMTITVLFWAAVEPLLDLSVQLTHAVTGLVLLLYIVLVISPRDVGRFGFGPIGHHCKEDNQLVSQMGVKSHIFCLVQVNRTL